MEQLNNAAVLNGVAEQLLVFCLVLFFLDFGGMLKVFLWFNIVLKKDVVLSMEGILREAF